MSARGVKGKPKKRKPTKPDNPEQSARFLKAAKDLGLGGDGQDFEKALDKVLPKSGASKK